MAPSEAMERLMIVLLSLAFSPAIFMLSFVIVLAGLGKTVGIRNFYIKTLLIIFEVSSIFQSDNQCQIRGRASASARHGTCYVCRWPDAGVTGQE